MQNQVEREIDFDDVTRPAAVLRAPHAASIAHALCNNNQADCADDIYLAPYMTGCPEGYDFPATEGACQRAADLSSGYEYGGAEGPYGGPDDQSPALLLGWR